MKHFQLVTYSMDDPIQSPRHTVYVGLQDYTRQEVNGPALLTPSCVTVREVEAHIDYLIQELEALKKEARSLFKR